MSRLEAVEFRENAWSRLVLNDQYKDVIRAMVKSHLTGRTKFQDLVAGKGAGLVVLLHGPPGIGKTLTAGKVAHYPLLYSGGLVALTSFSLSQNVRLKHSKSRCIW